jgi:5-methylcytosine-specific restriction enzyme subunit McrC
VKIPIRNIYYLFLYAWDYLPNAEVVDVGIDNAPDLPNLFARVLLSRTKRLLRRGLDRGYQPFEDELQGIRGRILLKETLTEGLLLRGAAFCSFDEFQYDVLHNQILKATISQLAKSPDVQRTTRHELALLARHLNEVSDIRLSGSAFSRLMVHRNNREYRLLMRLCEFVFWSQMPDPEGTGGRFHDILEDEVRMSSVFEAFLRNFCAAHFPYASVGAERVRWDVSDASEGDLALLPSMLTDVTLRWPGPTTILDAKYYRDPLSTSPYGSKVRSAHLYQLVTYLQHEKVRAMPNHVVAGALIYPEVGTKRRLSYTLLGMPTDDSDYRPC